MGAHNGGSVRDQGGSVTGDIGEERYSVRVEFEILRAQDAHGDKTTQGNVK